MSLFTDVHVEIINKRPRRSSNKNFEIMIDDTSMIQEEHTIDSSDTFSEAGGSELFFHELLNLPYRLQIV